MSEGPEEQQSTGVLGRIGSWLSPWRGKSPKSPTEHAFPKSDQTLMLEGEEESETSVRLRAREQQWEEEREQSSYPNLSRDRDAKQSAHREGSVVSSTEKAEGGPKEEEFVECRKKRVGHGKEREESSNSTSTSGNLEKNASHLTHLSSSYEQGVVWDSDRAHTQPQAQRQAQATAGRKLHVYLEETSVIHSNQNTSAGQEVVHTKVTKKNLQVKAKSSPSFDLSSSSTSAENKSTNVRPAVGAQNYYSALVGVSLKSHKDSQSEPEPEEETEADSMGRKNAARRKVRKNSQGEEGNSPQEKMPPNTQPVPEGIPISDNSVTSPPGKSPKTDMGESSVNSSSKHNPTSQASPEGAESKTSCPDTFKQLDNFQDSNSVIATTLADGGADMEGDDRFYKVQRKTETPESKRGHFTETSKREDRPVLRKKLDIIGVPQSSTSSVAAADMEDDSFYKVERKTETPESKRRSMKVSRSEVKLFTKNVPLKPKQSPAGDAQELKAALKNNKGEAMDKPKAEIDARLNKLKNIDEEPKAVVGRIADKISLFEHPAAGVNKQNSKTPRSADVSPVRKATEKPQSDYVLPDQRSRSAERYGTARSSSASPGREKPMTIKERARNFAETSQRQDRPALPQKPFMTGISKRPTSSSAVAASKSPELDDQGKRDTNEQIQKAKSEITKTKPDGRDPTAVGVKISIPEEQPIDSKTNNTVASKAAEQGIKPNRVETDIPSKEPVDSAELTNSISPQFKGPSRTGSRSKRRKSREPTSPISPNSENRSDCSTTKPELTAIKQHMDNTEEAASAPRQVTKEVSLPSDKAQGNTSDRQSLPDAKQKAFKNELKVVDKQKKPLEFSFKKENINKLVNRHEGLPEPSANKDTDTAVCSSGTKTPFDKDPVFLPQKDEKAVGHSRLFTERKEKEKANKDSKETSASPPIPAVERLTEKNALIKQEPPAADPKLEKELSMHSESRSKVRVREPNKKDTGQTTHSKDLEQKNHTKRKDVEGLEKVEGEKTNQTEKKYEETPQQLLHSDQKTTKTKVSDSRQGVSGTEGKAARDDENKDEAQTVKVSPSSEKTSSSPDLSAHKQHVCAVSQNNEAVSVTEREKVASKREQSTNVPPKILTKTTESPGTETTPVVIAAKPQPHSVSVEKTGNSPDDSCAHGANDVQFSKHITKATTAAETVTVKAADGPPALITAQTDMSEKESSVKGSTPIYVSKSVSSKGAGQDDEKKGLTVKSVPPEVKVSGNVMKPAPRQGKETQITESTSDITSLKGTKIAQSPSDSAASSPILNVVKKTADHLPITELSPVANGDIFLHPQLHTVKEELVNNKQRQSPKAPTSPQANKPIPESTQSSTKKKLHLPRGLSKDDSVTQQDAPSSWLDVDFPKRKLKIPVPKLSSSGSESNLLDTSGDLDDDDFIEKIKNLCAPFSLPPRKHSQLRPPQPPFAMPAIREDRFEKTFDPEEFKFGLRKENKFTVDTPPGLLAMLQNKETKSGLKPARASLADRSILLNSLDTHSRLRDSTPVQDEEDVKEDKDGQVKVKSRLEGSCVLSSLSSSVFRGKRNEFQTQAEGTSSGEVSPSGSPQLSPSPLSQPTSSPTATAPLKDTLALSSREEAQAVVSDSGPPFPSFNDIKLPDYLEKYLPREPAKPVQGIPGQEQVKTEVIGKMATPASGGEAVRPGPEFPDAVPPCFPEIPPITHPTVPEPKQSPAQPQAVLSKNIRAVKGFHKRPGKIVLFEKAQFSGQAHEIYGDVANATSLQFSPLISVKTVRGCWVLYEKPDFQGRTIALEEGCTELTNVWAEPGLETEPQNHPPMLIGSIRLAVRDYNLPCIDLFTEPEGRGRVTPYHDDIIETGSFGVPLSTASIQVHSGVWLVFSDPGFQGMLTVLEAGEYPFPETWGFPSPFVGSLRPLKMGGFKVENPNEVKAVLYEKPDLDGACLEIDCDVFSFYESEGNITTDGVNFDSTNLKSVGSLKIIGGLWVGYSEPGFEGQQYILEEGEYLDCSDWGGSAQLLSLRPILSDFMSPHLKMFSERHFGELGMNIDLTVPVFNMDDTGYSVKTQSVDVISGVWVVFEEPGFCGECYILEKGLYGSPEDWGALQPRVASVMPVVLDDFENAAKFKVQLFSEPGFQGAVLPLEDSVTFLQDSFSVASCKVLAGSWLAFEGQDFTGRMYVLELGSYPDLRAMGCVNASSSILSLQTVGFEFSLPSITLFERGGLKGKRVVLTEGSVNLQLAGGCSRVQSVVVEGGMWVLYEGINYRGPQILLKPGEVPEWRKFSSWQKIGSLRPLIQKRVHFRLRNRQTGLMMSVTGDLDEVKLLRIQEMEENDGFEQIWFYQNGHLHCKLLEECCLSPSGSVMMAGCRVGLTPETDNPVHLWSITPEGVICYSPSSDLVLDVKGGHNYDKNQVILKTLDPSKLQQRWDVEII